MSATAALSLPTLAGARSLRPLGGHNSVGQALGSKVRPSADRQSGRAVAATAAIVFTHARWRSLPSPPWGAHVLFGSLDKKEKFEKSLAMLAFPHFILLFCNNKI